MIGSAATLMSKSRTKDNRSFPTARAFRESAAMISSGTSRINRSDIQTPLGRRYASPTALLMGQPVAILAVRCRAALHGINRIHRATDALVIAPLIKAVFAGLTCIFKSLLLFLFGHCLSP